MMAFANNYVVSVLVNGKPQREFSSDGKRAVTLPFGSEYKIRIKNQSYKKALINVTIDGASIFSAGQQLILRGQESIDLERFVDNLSEGRKFKFVSKDQAAVEGHFDPTSSEMGLLKVEFVPELELMGSLLDGSRATLGGGILRSKNIGGGSFGGPYDGGYQSTFYCATNSGVQGAAGVVGPQGDSGIQANASYASAALPDSGLTAQNSVGGTVEGGSSNQQFGVSRDLVLWAYGQKTTIDIKMKGPSQEVVQDFGLVGLATAIRKKGNSSQEYKIHSVMTTTDGSITVVYK
jgi:hypothetical protein